MLRGVTHIRGFDKDVGEALMYFFLMGCSEKFIVIQQYLGSSQLCVCGVKRVLLEEA